MADSDSADLLTVKQVAEKMMVNRETVRRWLRKKVLRSIKISGTIRIPQTAIDEMQFGQLGAVAAECMKKVAE